jgi:CRISPR-associated endonuclease Cas1
MGASMVHLNLDGEVLTHSTPFGYDGHPIRRAQALAVANGLDVDLARYLIAKKMEGQRANLARLGVAGLGSFDSCRAGLDRTVTVDEVRICEAQAAAIYWNAWSKVSIRLRNRDLVRIPVAWSRYQSRKSTLTGAPRAATNPVNSLLNYVYSLLECEARLALLAAGLDPTLGVLHADQRNRDSFALDAMEPVRPAVDAFILDLLDERVLTSRDFVELPNGVCRVRAPMTHDLALTVPKWRQLMAPVIAYLAQAFRGSVDRRHDAVATPRTTASRHVTASTSAQSPLQRTPRKTSQPRPYASKTWGTPRPEPLRLVPIACAACGSAVVKRRRRHCDACIPGVKVAQANKAVIAAREALVAQAAAGKDPRKDPTMNQRRGVAISEGHRRNREWNREHPEQRDEAWFRREVLPRLDAFSLSTIANATGLSLAACSRIRSGSRLPHHRHWDPLWRLSDSHST